MTELEYNKRLKKIEAECDSAKKSLYKDFALSNTICMKGDIIKDNSGTTILVESITTYKSFGLPEPVYKGKELKKDLTPKKSGDIGSIWGNHGVEIIRKAETNNK